MDIVVAPFSNSAIRDWPATHFGELIRLLLRDGPATSTIRVIGTVGQRLTASGIVRAFASDRVRNECGRLAGEELPTLLERAACVVGNNSGIAHMAAYLGAPTICVFGGSHQRAEWRPKGPKVVVLSRAIGCSPCHLDHRRHSPYDKACLRQIAPGDVSKVAMRYLGRHITAAEGEDY